MKVALFRLPSLVAAVVLLAALAVLWRFRPEWPPLPGSLSAPVTTTLIQQLALVAAWLVASLVILILLVQILRATRALRPLDTPIIGFPATHRGRGRASSRALILPAPAIEPRLLVVAPRDASPPPEADEVEDLSKPAGVAEPDPRPLISLLGPLAIYGAKRSRRGLRARALEVIAYLALRREGAQRDEILEALWPGEDPKRSRHRLYQAVRDARRLLGNALASERDRYRLDRKLVQVDVDELEELLEEVREAGDDAHRRELLEKILKLFRAEPLGGCDFAWLENDVRSLRATYVDVLKSAGRARLQVGDARGALQAAERALSVEALDEDVWRLALEAEGALGLRDAIDKRYSQLRHLLRERLALEPARETRALYLRLLGQS